MDGIAKLAEVGAGTLYRHFPTREALLEAVYCAEVEKLARAADTFSQELEPIEALRAWMLLFVDYIAAKKIIAQALNCLVAEKPQFFDESHARIWGAVSNLVNRGVEAGRIRSGFDPVDLLRALIGVASVGVTPDWQASARKLVDVLVLGLQVAPNDAVAE